ncbi:HNH endonuclease [Listeria booriae]|uniref:HNH endonuclease n=1 Tax=Listeria booriae TaxID=1552123 RepID=A0A7X1D8H4_9LIST|nr:HNH endonuclease [Listeria booriae]MBC1572881.1 HNH endonuclease [Listeria booriae]MBC1777629.1 HNH endonuclease [Listeria booriae]MBC2176649.1 HNH endonuclease [Listeria booriae]
MKKTYRVHGDFIIKRRKASDCIFTTYKDTQCRELLKADFFDVCGYCGKKMTLLKAKAQIDHFIPQKIAPSEVNNYSNLVYSCSKCNRGKWYHWPTNDITISHNGKEGFVDPATDDFDKHLYRASNGEILPYTSVGEYMISKMRLDIRPIAIIWKVNQLNLKLEKVSKIIETRRSNGQNEFLLELLDMYHEASEELRVLLDKLYLNGEAS